MNLTQEDWISQLKADANAVILDVRTDDAMKVLSKTITIDIHQGQGFITAIEQLDKTKTIMCIVVLVLA
jgi:hypothetical protein